MRKLTGLAISVALLALLYSFIDVASIWRAAKAADPWWLAAGLAFIVPLTLLTAWRFTLLVKDQHVGFLEANRLILSSSTLNLFLPSKLGDFAKGHVLARRHGMRPSLAYAVVVLEKALDMLSLLAWGVLGLMVVGLARPAMLVFLLPVAGGLALFVLMVLPLSLVPSVLSRFGDLLPAKIAGAMAAFAASWQEMSAWFWREPWRAFATIGLSILLWGAHLFQFWLFAAALGADVPLLQNAAFATLSILVGLLPFTFAGVGTRDAAIVFFYAAYLSPGQAALLGILATLRYVLPAIGGVPFVADFAGISRGGTTRTDAQP
jgi:uncharacterized protein (TIRG00374 family)